MHAPIQWATQGGVINRRGPFHTLRTRESSSQHASYEDLGHLSQDESASGRRWSHCSAPLLYIGAGSPWPSWPTASCLGDVPSLRRHEKREAVLLHGGIFEALRSSSSLLLSSLEVSDTRVYEPHIRARLGTTAHFNLGHVSSLRRHEQREVVLLEVEIESIRKMLEIAADTGHSN